MKTVLTVFLITVFAAASVCYAPVATPMPVWKTKGTATMIVAATGASTVQKMKAD